MTVGAIRGQPRRIAALEPESPLTLAPGRRVANVDAALRGPERRPFERRDSARGDPCFAWSRITEQAGLARVRPDASYSTVP